MKDSELIDIWQSVTYAGAILIAIGTLGVFFLSEIKSKDINSGKKDTKVKKQHSKKKK